MTRDIDRMELPGWYDENTLTMLVINPNAVFLYWELSLGRAKTLPGRSLVLKLYELPQDTGEGLNQLTQSVALPPLTNDWYFYDLKPANRYRAEMGWEEGPHFYSLIKSNIVALPPASPSLSAPQARRKIVTILPAQVTAVTSDMHVGKPLQATAQEVIDSMSFYMGMQKENHPEGK